MLGHGRCCFHASPSLEVRETTKSSATNRSKRGTLHASTLGKRYTICIRLVTRNCVFYVASRRDVRNNARDSSTGVSEWYLPMGVGGKSIDRGWTLDAIRIEYVGHGLAS